MLEEINYDLIALNVFHNKVVSLCHVTKGYSHNAMTFSTILKKYRPPDFTLL